MKIVDYVKEQCECMKCTSAVVTNDYSPNVPVALYCHKHGMPLFEEAEGRTCGAWYLELTFQPDPVMKLDRERKVIHAYDFTSWVNLYQAPKVPHIRVLSREEWPEVKE